MVDGLQTTVYGNHNADNIAIMKKNRYATRMKNIVIAIVLFPILILLGAGCKDQGKAVQRTYKSQQEKIDYLECIKSARSEYDALTKNGTVYPEDAWARDLQSKTLDCNKRYGN